MSKEPSLMIGAITTAVAAILALLIAFGINLTQTQQVAILGIIAGVGPLVTGIATRSKAFAPANVAVVVGAEGLVAGPGAPIREGDPVSVSPLP